jgi:hypothetical protein
MLPSPVTGSQPVAHWNPAVQHVGLLLEVCAQQLLLPDVMSVNLLA